MEVEPTNTFRIRASELYAKSELISALRCGEWYINALVFHYALPPLGTTSNRFYEGGDVIEAMRRHHADGSPTKEQLRRRRRHKFASEITDACDMSYSRTGV